jgi:hypothetical protein
VPITEHEKQKWEFYQNEVEIAIQPDGVSGGYIGIDLDNEQQNIAIRLVLDEETTDEFIARLKKAKAALVRAKKSMEGTF